ncbi:MAG: hypothetical protein UT33_C0005G0034 [Candidatus Peregrinibacteria bacterium GW2011_GWC2_39_14]|nr:MAG: hypothetical protein US92_C0001G0034 [Candidatus Peregrinibacteria bacterium GW2011_GWA2_38_36]KKR07090.1 MAG: hypothetical protein UT33_C0005G0034 [Candidatus Peregrinibacteria bacterium GW2011_GWC2_39_14]
MGLLKRWRNRGGGEHLSGLDRRDELPVGFRAFRGFIILAVGAIGVLTVASLAIPGFALWGKYKKGEIQSPEDLANAVGQLNAALNQATVHIPEAGNAGGAIDTSALDAYMAPIIAKGEGMSLEERECVALYNKLKAFMVLKGDVSGVREDLKRCLSSLDGK